MKPSLAASTLRIFDLALGEMLWARRTVFMAAIAIAPVLLALVARAVAANGVAVLRVNGERIGSAEVFGVLISVLYLKFIVPALGVFYGTSLIADEVEDKTITYLFLRPIPRRSIVLGKYLAYLLCVIAVVLPLVTIAFVLLVPFASMAMAFRALLQDLGVLAIGLAAYGAVFLLSGVVLKRPLVAGLVFAFGWEQIVLAVPGYLKHLTIAYYLQAIAPHSAPDEQISSLLSLFWLVVITVGAVVLAMRAIERREYVLDQ